MAQKLNSNQLRDVSLSALWTMVEKLEQQIGRPLGGRSRAWWRSQSK
jgi:hypothetical protein